MSESQGKVLIVDDESALRHALRVALQAMGFEVGEAPSGEMALRIIEKTRYDVVLLDVNMAGMGGLQACREIRQRSARLGILMLTVRDSEEDKVNALDAGADDYVTKPFHVRELAARIRSAVRRSQIPSVDLSAPIQIGDLELDPAKRLFRKGGQNIRLTPKEFDLLHYLMAHAGLPLTHARLLRAVWGPEYGLELEYLRTYVRSLRRKLGDDAANPAYLLTDSHLGYRFAEAAPNQVVEPGTLAPQGR